MSSLSVLVASQPMVQVAASKLLLPEQILANWQMRPTLAVRLARYAELRTLPLDMWTVAAELRISPETLNRYEKWLREALPLMTGSNSKRTKRK